MNCNNENTNTKGGAAPGTAPLPALLDDGLKCNILLAGRTGSGKSSFANYLFGVDQFTTGSGKPVTSWGENFQQYRLQHQGMSINIIDTVGLEPDNYPEWMGKMEIFLDKNAHPKAPDRSVITHANELLHHVYYIVNGAGARLLDQELVLLDMLTQRWKLNVSLIITNSDCATEEQLAAIEERAAGKDWQAIRVCSITRRTRGGSETQPFGRDEAIRKLLESSWERVGSVLTDATLDSVLDFFEELRRRTIAKIDRENINIISLIKDDNMDDFLSHLNEEFDELSENLGSPEDLLPPSTTATTTSSSPSTSPSAAKTSFKRPSMSSPATSRVSISTSSPAPKPSTGRWKPSKMEASSRKLAPPSNLAGKSSFSKRPSRTSSTK